jgi:hypothetical protein
MVAFKKIIFSGISAVLGLLLILAGLNLIQVSTSLNLYSGIILVILAALMYFLI